MKKALSEKQADHNPLLEKSNLPHGVPPFDRIREEHYMPAVEHAIDEARRNIDAIKADKHPADFKNAIVALEMSSDHLGTVTSIFYNQLSAAGSDGLHAL